jgi:hypothetical protein
MVGIKHFHRVIVAHVGLDLLTNIVILTIGAAGFLAMAVLLHRLGVSGKKFDLALYVFAIAPLPLLCTWASLSLQYRFSDAAPQSLVVMNPARAWTLFLVALLLLPALFFDFSLTLELLHYLTNIGPAVHILYGGVLLVDTFSQYGPGPVLAILAGFAVGPLSFGTANIVVQLINITYFALFLFYVYHATGGKRLSLLFGLISIAFLMEAWGRGEGNLNTAPSPLMRYLPTLIMVVAISVLRPPARHSTFTAAATILSAIWSVETLFGTFAVYAVFLVALGIRDRSWSRIVTDILIAALPAIISVATFSLAVYLRFGTAPRFDIYLDFLSTYNPVSDYWAKPLQNFFWWIPFLVAGFLVLSHSWAHIIGKRSSTTTNKLLYHLLPMTVLCFWAALYFVGRSIDYTLLLAFLPFAAVIIVAGEFLLQTCARVWVISAAIIVAAYGIYESLGLWRPDGPYSFLVQECRDHGRCSLALLRERIEDRLRTRPGYEPLGNPWADYRLDNGGVLREAMSLIEQNFAPGVPATVLLGRVQYVSYLSDLALIYTGHWHRWPISFTFTDDLVPPLVQNIVATPVQLHDGEVVVVRKEEDTLEGVEKEILAKIRADYHLCEIPNDLHHVTAYRISLKHSCGM